MDYDPQQYPVEPTPPNPPQPPSYPPQPPYNVNPQPPYPPQPPYVQEPQKNGMAIASFVIGICSLVFSCCLYYLTLPAAIVGLILGIIAVRKKPEGKNMAIAGIVLCSIAIMVSLAMLIFLILAIVGNVAYSGSNFY